MKKLARFDALFEIEVDYMTEQGHSKMMEYGRDTREHVAFCAPDVRFFSIPCVKLQVIRPVRDIVWKMVHMNCRTA